MASDETRTILIDVEVEDKDFDKEIGEVNTQLKTNREEIKALSKDYEGNATQIAKLDAKNKELTKSKQSLVKESKTEAGSLDALRLKLANQVKERNNLNKTTVEGAARFKELQESIGDLNQEIGDFEQESGDFRRNVGNYPSLADQAGGAFANLWKVLLANPLIALVTALAGLVKIFSESQAGAEFFQKASAALNTTLGFLSDIVEELGVFLIDTFSNPQQALEDFGNLVKENIINRFEGLLELIPQLGKAITLLFEGDFAEAAKVAGDAIIKVSLGVENFTDKVLSAAVSTAEFFNQVAIGTQKAFALEQQLIANTKAIADQDVEVAKSIQRQKELELAIDDTRLSIEDRIAAAQEFGRVEQEQIDESVRLAEERLRILQAQNDLTNSTEEDIQRVRDQEIQLATLQAASADRRRAALTKENALIDSERNRQLAEEKAFAKAISDINKQQDIEDAEFTKIEEERAKSLAEAKKEAEKSALDTSLQLLSKSSAIGKGIALTQAVINTARAATLALASIPPPFSFAAAGAAVAAGAIQIAKIKSTRTFGGGGNSGAAVGGAQIGSFNPVQSGLPADNRGVAIAVSGLVAGNDINQANSNNRFIANSIRNIPSPVVAVTDINTAQDSRQVKVNESSLA